MCDFDSFFCFQFSKERERDEKASVRDDICPLNVRSMSQKNFKIEEIMVVVGKKSLLWP